MRSSATDVLPQRVQDLGIDVFKTGTEMQVHKLVYAPKPMHEHPLFLYHTHI